MPRVSELPRGDSGTTLVAKNVPGTSVFAPRQDGHRRPGPDERGGFGLDPRYLRVRRCDPTDYPADVTTVPSTRSRPRSLLAPVRRLGAWFAEVAANTTRRSVADDITGVASQFAYNAFLATVPFLFVLVSIIGLVAEPTVRRVPRPDADNAIPVELRQTLRSALDSATRNTGQAALFLAIGLFLALYVSANVMGALVGGLDRIRGVPHRPWVRGKLAALVIALATSVLVVATTLALIGGSRLVESVAEEVFGKGAPNVAGRVLYLIGTASLLVFTVAVYHVGPNAPRRRLLASAPGALVGVGLWLGVTRLFALYIENFDEYRTVYGALAAAAIYLIFLFLTCVSLLIGAEVNEQIYSMRVARRRERDPTLVSELGLAGRAPEGGAVGVALAS